MSFSVGRRYFVSVLNDHASQVKSAIPKFVPLISICTAMPVCVIEITSIKGEGGSNNYATMLIRLAVHVLAVCPSSLAAATIDDDGSEDPVPSSPSRNADSEKRRAWRYGAKHK